MINVISGIIAVIYHDYVTDNLHQVFFGQRAMIQVNIQAKSLVELVTADRSQVIAHRVKEQTTDKFPCVLRVGQFSRPQLLVDIKHRLSFVPDQRFAVNSRLHIMVVGGAFLFGEQAEYFFITAVPDGPQQCRNRNLPLAVYLGGNHVAVAGLEFQPRAAGWNQLGEAEITARRRVFHDSEIDTRRAQ